MRSLCVAVAFLSSSSFAAGFMLDAQSARAVGQGEAVNAMVDDPSAIYYNPAGIAGKAGLFARVGVSLIAPKVTFAPEGGGTSTSTLGGISPPIHAYLVYAPADWVAVGLGFFTPFGSSVNWPEDASFNTIGMKSSVQTFNFNPTVAFQFTPRIRFGGGLDITKGTVVISRALNFIDSQGKVELGGSGNGIGWNLGVQAELVQDILWMGGSWRSGMAMDFTGNAHFTGVPVEFQGNIYDQKITSSITLPNAGTIGFGIKPHSRVRLAVDGTYVGWSSFPELRISFQNPALTVPVTKSWMDQMSFRIGAEVKASDMFDVRAGFVWDPTPSPSQTLTPDLPDSTRLKICLGLGFKYQGLTADLGYQLVVLLENKSISPVLRGTYSGMAHVVGITVGYDWLFGGEKKAEAKPADAPAPAPVEQPKT